MDGAAVEQADRTLSGKRARKGETSAGLIAARDQNDAELLSKTKRQREKEASLQTDMDAYVAMLNDKGGSAAGLKKKGKGKSKGVMREGYEKEADSSDDDSDDGKTGVGFQEGFDESSDEEDEDDDDDDDASSVDLDDVEGEHIDQVLSTKCTSFPFTKIYHSTVSLQSPFIMPNTEYPSSYALSLTRDP
jgi:hypothetical protein